jgi:hypothetical protein
VSYCLVHYPNELSVVQRYRAYFLDNRGYFSSIDELDAADDAASVAQLQMRLPYGNRAELWCGSRRLGVVAGPRRSANGEQVRHSSAGAGKTPTTH